MLQRQKYYLLELREHYETFQEKRQYTIRVYEFELVVIVYV